MRNCLHKFNIGDRLQAFVYSKLKFLQYKLIEQPYHHGVEG
ncbi:hypothetical protein GXM_07666 [Nostoc sphaeroides CCNUC1]|uniref:Uncharacterized protein n=1 Tax=Nostoc sphaeroides CCNUC1 TaxID=2653204 RepID=A0A5P8WCA7_9NOSO|nr:hypothetical protein GXM_07666 [Nostoc sphaeroides CCNUC1]